MSSHLNPGATPDHRSGGVKMKRVGIAILIALVTVGLNRAPARSAQQGAGKLFNGKLAVQLWSFRNDFKKDVPGTLKRVRELGFTNVELAGYYGMTAKQFRAELDKAGLRAVSMHIDLQTARDHIEQVNVDAKALGVEYVGVPWIKSPFTREDCLAAIEVFNQAGKRLSAAGLGFFYHLHGYEFVPDPAGTGTLFDLLMTKTDPRYVSLQLDTAHVAFPGVDPAELLRKYPGRFTSLHLKDVRGDIAGNNSGVFKDEDGRPLGKGKINWPDVLTAARREGVRWYIIEDETPGVWQGIPESLAYLQHVTHQSAANSSVLGTWTGESICAGNRPACKDEVVVYQFESILGKSGAVMQFADKILNGQRVPMGKLECRYDEAAGKLTCEFTRGQTHGVWHYTVAGDSMDGTLVLLPGRELGRRVKVKRVDPAQVPAAPGHDAYEGM
jgi:sugar phosphate isomerase/epimerase